MMYMILIVLVFIWITLGVGLLGLGISFIVDVFRDDEIFREIEESKNTEKPSGFFSMEVGVMVGLIASVFLLWKELFF